MYYESLYEIEQSFCNEDSDRRKTIDHSRPRSNIINKNSNL